MGNKGQVEFIALFGIIFVVVVVVFYAYQGGMLGSSPVPYGVAQQQKSVQNSIDNFVRLGALEVLSNMSLYGGYPNEDAFFSDIEFNKRPVAYWLKKGSATMPTNIEGNFMTAVKSFITENMPGLVEEMDADNVTIDYEQTTVTGNILPDKIILYVSVPITVQGYAMGRIEVTIPTRFGETIDYAKGLTSFASQKRPFEYYTLKSMVLSEPDNGLSGVPFHVTNFECGNIIMRNWFDIQPHVEKQVKLALGNIDQAADAPPQIEDECRNERQQVLSLQHSLAETYQNADNALKTAKSLENPSDPTANLGYYQSALAHLMMASDYMSTMRDLENLMISKGCMSYDGNVKSILPKINNKVYPGLDTTFHLPDGFEFTRFRMSFTPDPIMVIPEMVPLSPLCKSDPVYVKYHLMYPMVVRIEDEDTGNIFQFAYDIYIEDNQPGPWSSPSYGYDDEQTELCASSYCDAKITVNDMEGNPVPNAYVSFMGCDVGKTLLNGILYGKVPCAAGQLRVYKKNYKEALETASFVDLRDHEVTLRYRPGMTIHIYEVNVRNDPLTDPPRFKIFERDIWELEDKVAHIHFYSNSDYYCEGESRECYRQFDTASAELKYLASDTYTVTAHLVDEAQLMWGITRDTLVITDSMEAGELYLYIPVNLEFSEAGDAEKMDYGEAFENLFDLCGIDPISTVPQSLDGVCIHTHGEVGL